MHRDRIALFLFPMALALGAAVSCTTSDPVDTTGSAGTSGGSAGTSATGTAGTSATGTAGTSATGTAGTSATGTAGTSATGTAGTSATGTAGTSATGTAGTSATGTAGTSATGTAGTTAPADGGAGTGAATLSFATDIYAPIIMTNCSPCHTTGTSGNLSMKDATTAFKNLVGTTMGVAATTDTGCTLLSAAKKRVVPGDPVHSYIYIKVSHVDADLTGPKCGPAMPDKPASGTRIVLTSDQQQKIHDWIMGGANP